MKENVDLTENRDFRRRDSSSMFRLKGARKFLKRINNLHFPWNDVKRITSTVDKREELFFVGNKYDRRYKSMYQFNDDNVCERCGIEIGKKPWIVEYGLCKRCDDIVSNVGIDSKCPWNKR